MQEQNPLRNLVNNMQPRRVAQDQKSNQENIITQYRQLSQAYDNAQQRILDLEAKIKKESKSNEEMRILMEKYNVEEILMKQNLNFGEYIDLQGQCQNFQLENQVLKQQSHQFLELNSKLGEDLKLSYEDIAELEKQLNERESQLEELAEFVEQLKENLQEKDDQKQFLLQELQQAKETLVVVEQKFEKSQNKKKTHKNTIKTLNHQIDKLQQQHQQAVIQFQQDTSQMENHIKQLQAHIQKLNQNASQKDLETLQSTLQKVYQELSSSRSESRALREERQRYEAQQSELNNIIKGYETQLKNQVSDSTLKLNEKDVQIEDLAKQIENLQVQNETMESEIESAKQQIEKQNELEQVVVNYEAHCQQLQQELQCYGNIINKYQETMQVVMHTLKIQGSDNIDEFLLRVAQELQRLRQSQEKVSQLEQQLHQQQEHQNKVISKLKKEHEAIMIEIKAKQQQEDLSDSMKSENQTLHSQIQQMAMSLEQQHNQSADSNKTIKRLRRLNQLAVTLLEKVTLSLNGDHLELMKEITEVFKLNIQKTLQVDQSDIKILEVRMQALLGELESLQELDHKRQKYYQAIEKQNCQLKSEIQSLKVEMDMKDMQRRTDQQSQRNQKRSLNSTEKNDIIPQAGSNKKPQLSQNTSNSIIS